MKKLLSSLVSNARVKASLFVVAFASMFASSAHAVLPPEATAASAELATDGASLISSFWPVLIAITIGLIIMRVFKKGANTAT